MPGPDRTYRAVVRVFGLLFSLMGYRFTVRGTEHIPAEGPGVIASNHTGYLDFTFIGFAARSRQRRVRFMAKHAVFHAPVVGRLMRTMRHIPVERRAGWRAYRHGQSLLEAGELVGVFPEATISRSWLLKPFKPGAAGLSHSRGVPLIPVIVWGGHRVITVDGHRSFRRRIPITILIGKALTPADDESIAELSARLEGTMKTLLDEAIATYPDEPRNEQDRWWLPYDRGGSAPDSQLAAALDREAVARLGDRLD